MGKKNLTKLCLCREAMLIWVSVGSASLRSVALTRKKKKQKKAEIDINFSFSISFLLVIVSSELVSWVAAELSFQKRERKRSSVVTSLPDAPALLQQRPYAIRASVVWDRSCLHYGERQSVTPWVTYRAWWESSCFLSTNASACSHPGWDAFTAAFLFSPSFLAAP